MKPNARMGFVPQPILEIILPPHLFLNNGF
jgi:hypothetical protein